ncbi:MAG: NTP transferase domain-containing protein [Thermomicrobiales bacterium]|nr:NTP transferase domain-containing protein [Thermomicrobiales bacterium]
MDVILPVAGLGSRLRPQTWTKPKPLVSVAGKAMLAHVIDRVLPAEPDSIVFITGFLGDQIEAWARETIDLPLAFVEQPVMRGQTDAILRARGLAQADALILFPDMLFEADFRGLTDVDADVVMFTKEVEDPSALGVAVVEGDRITRLVEKPQEPVSNLAVIGIYYVKDMNQLYSAIDEQMERGISLKNEYFIADAIQIMIDRGAKVIPMNVTAWEDCGNVENLLSTNRYILDRSPSHAPESPTSVVIEPSIVADDAILEHSVIGPYASVGAGSVVRNSRVQNSVVEERALIENAQLDASIVGRRARVVGLTGTINIGDDGSVCA